MTYIITNQYEKIVTKLNTELKNAEDLRLKIYDSNNNLLSTITPSISDNTDGTKTATFEIKHKSFDIGDELAKFLVVLDSTQKLYELNEKVSILIDGNETNVMKFEENGDEPVVDDKGQIKYVEQVETNRFGVVFNTASPHTIQAVYKGNDEIGVAVSPQLTVVAEIGGGGACNYKITRLDKEKTYKYMETPDWAWRLTCNGSPVRGKTIERILPTTTLSADTNAQGEVYIKSLPREMLAKWKAGKTYTIIARFFDYTTTPKRKIAEHRRTIKVEKNTPTMFFKKSEGKGDKFAIGLRDPQGGVMPNEKIHLTINGKTSTKLTNTNGNVWVKTNHKGRYKGKATFGGNDNFESKSLKFDQVIN